MSEQIIIPADKKLRKQVIIGILVFALVGGILIYFMFDYFEACKALAHNHPELAILRIRKFLVIVMIVNALVSSALGIYFISLAIKVFRTESYPPEGMRVIRDTKLVIGKRAKQMAFGFVLIAMTALSTNLMMGYIYLIFNQVFH